MMKLVFILPDLGAGGAERVVTILGREMVQRGILVDILLFLSNRVQYDVPEGVRVVKLNTYSLSKQKKVEQLQLYFKEQCNQHKELIAVPFHDSCLKYALAASFGQNVRVIACERNDPYQKGKNGLCRLRALLPYLLAKRCVFQTQDAMDYYGRWVKKKSRIIMNPLILPEQIVWQGQQSKQIVAVGRLQTQKNHNLLIDAFAQVHSALPEYTLNIYGEGALRSSLQKKIDDLGLHNAVNLCGFEKNVHQRLVEAALFILSSDYEGMSNALMEALAIGVPTISTDHPIGGARVLIKDSINGLLTPVGDMQAMADAMMKLLREPELAQRLSEESQKIRQLLAADAIVDQWVEMLDGIVRCNG